MIDRKAVTGYAILAFAISWPLFLIPLTLRQSDPPMRQLATQGFWALAMWGPGLAAIATTVRVQKRPWRFLRLNTLGPKRFYLWAWLLPTGLTLAGGAFTLLFGLARLDLQLTTLREALAQTPALANVPPAWLVAVQIFVALSVAPLINLIFALGEELGWRGFLLRELLPLGQGKAILLSGLIWGLWHAPAVVQGLNYPGYPLAGVPMMIVFSILLGTILSWLYLNTTSPWAPALAHGAVNAVAGLPLLFFRPGFNLAFGGTLATPPAWLAMALFIGWLYATRRLPAPSAEEWPGGGAPTQSPAREAEQD